MSYVRFYSTDSFTLGTNGNVKLWNGTAANAMEYSTDANTWSTWTGTSAISAVATSGTYNLYLRGTGNTKLTTVSTDSAEVLTYVFTGDGLIDCEGTIESLFDYATVDNNQHPTMANYACVSIFYNQTTLRTPPELGSPNLSNGCYARMFMGCMALTQIPALPATTLTSFCYSNMFKNCSSLTTVPINALPATTAVASCYRGMFANCTSLISPPRLPATTLQNTCYYCMFENCTSLLIAPDLPALTLNTTCYSQMFKDCTSITIPPALPATTLYGYCYSNMFQNTGIKLSTTQHDDYTLAYRIPAEGTGTTASSALANMFYGSGVNTPSINTTYYIKDLQYMVTESEITAIADAIRLSSNSNSSLIYPNDFIDEIEDMGNAFCYSKDSIPNDDFGNNGDLCIVS